ncbi:MAG: hypothetical protein J0I41_08130 [Filimonas sp.]|nr:hypothetical protein [Filimonas sp.]
MILLWALVNISLFLFFVVICFKAVRLIRINLGKAATIVFVIGMFSFMNQDSNKETTTNDGKIWSFASANDSLYKGTINSLSTSIENTMINERTLMLNYTQDKETKRYIPLSASISMSGLISGCEWTPVSVAVHTTSDVHTLTYSVNVVETWRLLNFTLYKQFRDYKGLIYIP